MTRPTHCRFARVSTLVLFLALIPTLVHAASVRIGWNPNSEADLAGYQVLYGTGSGSYSQAVDVGMRTEWELSNLQDGRRYFVVVRAYNVAGMLSAPSLELTLIAGEEACLVSVSSRQLSFDVVGGLGTVAVSVGGGCNWTASSAAGWITILTGGSGTGNGSVRFAVAPNSSRASRAGTMTIAGQSVRLIQTGPPSPPFPGPAPGPTPRPRPRAPSTLEVDFDGDCRTDVFRHEPSSGRWAIALGGGEAEWTGSWAPGWSVEPADLDINGLTDLMLYNRETGTLAHAINDGRGGFALHARASRPDMILTVADFDGNGHWDALLYHGRTGVWSVALTGSAAGEFVETGGTWESGDWWVAPADFNRDAASDLFAYSPGSGRAVVLASGEGQMTAFSSAWPVGRQIAVADFTGDRRADLLTYDPRDGAWSAALSVSDGQASLSGRWAPAGRVEQGDFDGNGVRDVLLYVPASGAWMVCTNGTPCVNGRWAAERQVHVADFNGDGRSDVLIHDPSTGVYTRALNLGNLTFEESPGQWPVGEEVFVAPNRR